MTIHKIPCQDGLCIVRVDNESNKPFATTCFTDEYNAECAIEMLKYVIAECGQAEPTIVIDKTT